MKRIYLLMVFCACWFRPSPGRAEVERTIELNNEQHYQTNINVYVNFFGVAANNIVVINLGGIFDDPPIFVNTPDAIDPFCGPKPSGGGYHYNMCPDHNVPQPTWKISGKQNIVTFSPDPTAPPISIKDLTSAHYGFDVCNANSASTGCGSSSNPGQLIENPQFESSFITLEDTKFGTCGGAGQPPCQQTFTDGNPDPVVHTTGTNTQYLIAHWETATGEGWTEFPVNPSNFSFSWLNYSGTPMPNLTFSGYQISPTLIPLDQLNADNPTYGDGNLGAYTPVSPIVPVATPEPSMWVALAVLLPLLLWMGRKRVNHAPQQ